MFINKLHNESLSHFYMVAWQTRSTTALRVLPSSASSRMAAARAWMRVRVIAKSHGEHPGESEPALL